VSNSLRWRSFEGMVHLDRDGECQSDWQKGSAPFETLNGVDQNSMN
jgi:hypothetical protein